MKYAVLSDIHCHGFTMFSGVTSDGVNLRLSIILKEMLRAAEALRDAGGDTMVIAGDIVHTRGQIDPEVLNPLRQTIERILGMGIDIYAIPGNHDLKSAETCVLSSSIENLAQISPSGGVFRIFNDATLIRNAGCFFGFVPWQNTKEGLLREIEDVARHAGSDIEITDLFIHAGIDGVLSGVPAHGLTHTELGKFGFRRVFAGHYHNHVDFGNGVVSIGATTQHNWGDLGTKAGFLLVEDTTGDHTFEVSQAPSFVDVSGMDDMELSFTVPGSYCRVRGAPMSQEDIKALREKLRNMGAAGVSIEVPPANNALRTTAVNQKIVTIDQSIEDYVRKAGPMDADPDAVIKRAIEVLNETRAVAV